MFYGNSMIKSSCISVPEIGALAEICSLHLCLCLLWTAFLGEELWLIDQSLSHADDKEEKHRCEDDEELLQPEQGRLKEKAVDGLVQFGAEEALRPVQGQGKHREGDQPEDSVDGVPVSDMERDLEMKDHTDGEHSQQSKREQIESPPVSTSDAVFFLVGRKDGIDEATEEVVVGELSKVGAVETLLLLPARLVQLGKREGHLGLGFVTVAVLGEAHVSVED